MTHMEMSTQSNDSYQAGLLESTPSNENPLFYWLRKLASDSGESSKAI